MIGMSNSSVARAAESTLDRKADSFAKQGMVSFFASKIRAFPKTSASLVGSAHALLISMRRSVDFRQTLNESPAHQFCAERYARRQ